MYIHIHIYEYIYSYIYTHIYTYIDTYTHTPLIKWENKIKIFNWETKETSLTSSHGARTREDFQAHRENCSLISCVEANVNNCNVLI